jgi:hypothetical protein
VILNIATTTTGKHLLKLNNSTLLANLDIGDCTFYKAITTVGDNFYTDGE